MLGRPTSSETSVLPIKRSCGQLVEPAVRLRISLRDTEPAVWRRIVVPGSMSLLELHAVIQTAMGCSLGRNRADIE